MTTLDLLRSDRVLSVVRAPAIDDARDLCSALVAGGIHVIELTFTTPDLPRHLDRAASGDTGAVVGAGTVQTAEQARAAVDAGAQFLVTPGQGPEAAAIVAAAHDAGIPIVLGAFTPSEVMTAVALGSDAVKIFPAHHLGPKYLKDLGGPFPGVPLVPSGGVNAGNARQFLDAGALAVSAGTDVVSPADVAAGRWADITEKASTFCAALR
ncbi:2-dehydro-3-deoxyphosphogluconate aldolase/(4S)-4-hydroxy-2-oxoglutarate aldolase [Kribbella orskensis]|uniref:2-dehydro-3-deoxyphosphogluconate aldolase/(4S)-4-hydroxy-2-oxoglutarate aldolase n=1 Tax=Kribbella orskensis TaxID=2512216 RepID=A0ABY2BJN9_9ACTN|nr:MULTISPECIES: bifunctional 4-hydroxy-2-oxoglutarate aldolase/2-dehydro-3-deoxy-phosphogluconate aldolase [Kribbella]TCN38621.1 2-dehydro-3-deoxyphosphogluconate aldolase/(4S)-4-hydroxy-2-oxoglutarate aldolase [Kribbella sp. VKM Ac-2500]TCO20802.1 2-dehydro-3-deoxyphosphogluconate aldolase/(4S)-4-hydroxy-2-oxoglutarate aldolase [Kribbella orskensis]